MEAPILINFQSPARSRMKSKKPVGPVNLNYRVMLQADVGFLIKALGSIFVIFTLTLIVFVTFSLNYLHTNLGLLVGAICLWALFLSTRAIFYILNLCFNSGMVLTMDRYGLNDECSPVQWGFRKIDQIEYIRFTESLVGDFLKVRMKMPLPIEELSGLRRWNAKFFRRFDPNAIYVPLDVLDVSRVNLESQLMHFGVLMKLSLDQQLDNSDTVLDKIQKQYNIDSEEEPTRVSEDAVAIGEISQTQYEVESNTGSFAIPEAPVNPDEHTFVPPPVDPSSSEKSQIVIQISALKAYVRQRDLDKKACDLFSDFVSQFPRWTTDNDPRLPDSIKKAVHLSQAADYEEISFLFKDQRFHFAIRRDIGSSETALLSIAFQGRVKMTLRVAVEIGVFEPVEIEVYHRDHWEKFFLDLYKTCFTSQFGNAPQEFDSVTRTRELDIEKLKQNFSVDPDSRDDA